jgi:hypothetical protein
MAGRTAAIAFSENGTQLLDGKTDYKGQSSVQLKAAVAGIRCLMPSG